MDLKNILSKLDELKEPVSEASSPYRLGKDDAAYKAEKFPKGRVHKGSYGSEYGTDEEGEEVKKAAPAVKRGKGRPRKDADASGQVKDFSGTGLQDIGWIPTAPKKIPAGRKHSLKEYFDELDAALNEAADTQPIPVVGKGGAAGAAAKTGFVSAQNPETAKALASLIKQNKAQLVVPDLGQQPAAGTPQQPGQTQPATPAPAGATGTAPAGQQSMGEDYDDDDMAQVRKIRAKLLRIPGFKRNVSDEQAQLAMAERMYELLKRDMSFDQALVMAQRGRIAEGASASNSDERPYVCVHAKKGKCDVKAKSSYDAVKKAAEKWKLKNTAGIDAYLADKPIDTGNLEESEKWIQKAVKHPGAFTKKAQAAGKSVAAFAKEKEHAPGTLGKQARLAKTLSKVAKGKEDMSEGDLPPQDGIMGAGLGAGRSQSTMESNKMAEGKKAKPDFLDLDKDGNTKETMKKAAADKKKSVEGSKLTESAYNSAKAGLQRTVDFAKKRGYVIRKSPTSKAVIFFNKDIGHKLAAIVDNDGSSINVNFKDYSSGMSGNDDASYFDKTFKEAYKNALEEHKYQQYVQKHFGDDDMMENITESISLKESPSALEHIVNKFKHEVKNFIAGEELDSDLYDALFDYYAGHGEMPYGIAKARTGDPFEWVTNRFEQDVQDVVDECQMPIRGLVGEEMPAATVPGMADAAMDEGNAFTRGLAKARKGDKFTVAGTTFTDTSNYDDPSVRENSMFESWDNQLSSLLEEYQEIQEGLSISVSKGNEGAPDSVTV